MSRLLSDVVGELSKLPGIGRRTALRLAMHILKMDAESVADMTSSIDRFRRDIRYCSHCNNLSDEEVCPICSDPSRDRSTVCVVEQVADLMSIENTHQYRGLYHVLGGVISPMQGIAPSDLKIDMLVDQCGSGRHTRGDTGHIDLGRGRDNAFLHQEPVAPLPRREGYDNSPRYRFRRRTGVCR